MQSRSSNARARSEKGTRGGLAGRLWNQVRSALWPLPTLAVTGAIVLGVFLPDLDGALDSPDGHPLFFAFGGGPSAARDLLNAIAGSLISVTGLVFSLTVVTLQLASSQYSPRLLQTFVTDRFVQVTLAQLSATFVYALTVLRTVRTESATETEDAFVPRLAITVAYVLAVGSVLALVFFLAHLARSLRVETMLRDVHDEGLRTLGREFPEEAGDDDGRDLPLPSGTPEVVLADSSGFVTDIDEARLIAGATNADAVLQLAPRIGDSVVSGVPLGHVWRRRTPDDSGASEDLTQVIRQAVRLDYERSPGRDIAYSLRKVVDIAVRALSPGINDPTTAVHALAHVSAMLGDLLVKPLQPRRLCDEDGRLRLVITQWGLTDLLDLALEEPLAYAEGAPAVLRRIAALLRELAWRLPAGTADDVVRTRLGQLTDLAEASTSVTAEELASWRKGVEDALAGRWGPVVPPESASSQPVATPR